MSTILSWKGFAKSRDVERLQRQFDDLRKSTKNLEESTADVSVAVKKIIVSISALQSEVTHIRKDLGDFRERQNALKDMMASSHSSIVTLLEKLNENKLTKDDLEVIASFLRFIAANQLVLEETICGESEKASNDLVEEKQ